MVLGGTREIDSDTSSSPPLNFTGIKNAKSGPDCRPQSTLRCSDFEMKQKLVPENLKHALGALMIDQCPPEVLSKYGRSPSSDN